MTDFNLTARSPHRAMAEHVDAYGCEQAQGLYLLAELFNIWFFEGRLGDLMIEIAAPASPNALATHQPKTPEGCAGVIRIAPAVVVASDELAADALLHEMLHVWQTETDNREDGYAGHGPKFAGECNRISLQLGLEGRVGVKGRGGLPDCAQWPLNLRPEGYYGEQPRAKKAEARARGRKPGARATSRTRVKVCPVEAALALVESMDPAERAQFMARLVENSNRGEQVSPPSFGRRADG